MDYSDLLESASRYLTEDLNASLSNMVNAYYMRVQATMNDDTCIMVLYVEDRSFEFSYRLEDSIISSSHTFSSPEDSYAYFCSTFFFLQALTHAANMTQSSVLEGIMSPDRGLFTLDDIQASLVVNPDLLFSVENNQGGTT